MRTGRSTTTCFSASSGGKTPAGEGKGEGEGPSPSKVQFHFQPEEEEEEEEGRPTGVRSPNGPGRLGLAVGSLGRATRLWV